MNWQLVFSVLLMYGIIILVNIPASLLGLSFDNNSNTPRLWFEPPGFVVPIVWFFLFTLMGIARYVLLNQGNAQSKGYIIIGLAVLCASYAFYTLGLSKLTGLSPLWFGLWGNIVVILATLVVCWILWRRSVTAVLLVAPVIAWTTFATFIIVGQLRLQGLL
jgi:tryptophan-rich sensory protein